MRPSVNETDFLEVEDVLTIHQAQIRRFGGSDGLRDRGLLESAVAQPQAGFGGVRLHEDIQAMAAAYWFHLVANHAFVDGNKRTGLVAALAFLELNGWTVVAESSELYEMTVSIASGQLEKGTAASWLRAHTRHTR